MNDRFNPHRFVVKVGTTTLTDAAGRIDRSYIRDLAGQLGAQHSEGRELLLVTSGAIRAGKDLLEGAKESFDATQTPELPNSRIPENLNSPTTQQPNYPPPARLTVPMKQAAAAVGQGLLMQTYMEAFSELGIVVGQVLLTRDDLADRHRFLNARNTLNALFAMEVIPIVNENDTVATDEIKFGDNDTLAARVAALTEADLLLILSDVDGLYRGLNTDSPSLVHQVDRIDGEIEALAGDSGSISGTGGMRTKIEAAKIAAGFGIRTVIAKGRRKDVIEQVLCGAGIGTTFLPSSHRLRGRKRWIAAGARTRGAVQVNSGAAERLYRGGASLLAVGVTGATGDFDAGDLIDVQNESGQKFARGLTNYSAVDVRLISGLRSDQFATVLGYDTDPEVIHRDNLVVQT